MALATYGFVVPWLRQKLADFEPEKVEQEDDQQKRTIGGNAFSTDDDGAVEMTENQKVAATVEVK